MKELNERILNWASGNNVFQDSNPLEQAEKILIKENDLFSAISNNESDVIKVVIGDIYALLAIQCEMHNLDVSEVMTGHLRCRIAEDKHMSSKARNFGAGIDSAKLMIANIEDGKDIKTDITRAYVLLLEWANIYGLDFIDCANSSFISSIGEDEDSALAEFGSDEVAD